MADGANPPRPVASPPSRAAGGKLENAMIRNLSILVLLSTSVLASATQSSAISCGPVRCRDVFLDASLVVVGTVADVVGHDTTGRVATIDDLTAWVGEPGPALHVNVTRRGACDFSDARSGERAALFLYADPEAGTRLTGGGQGYFPIISTPDGQETVKLPCILFLDGLEVPSVTRDPLGDPKTVSLADLRRLVEDKRKRAEGSR